MKVSCICTQKFVGQLAGCYVCAFSRVLTFFPNLSKLAAKLRKHSWIFLTSTIRACSCSEDSSSKEAVYSANISEKNQHQNELILDADPVKEYGNQPPKFPKEQVMIYYRYKNKPQRYIHKKPNIKPTLLYM